MTVDIQKNKNLSNFLNAAVLFIYIYIFVFVFFFLKKKIFFLLFFGGIFGVNQIAAEKKNKCWRPFEKSAIFPSLFFYSNENTTIAWLESRERERESGFLGQ